MDEVSRGLDEMALRSPDCTFPSGGESPSVATVELEACGYTEVIRNDSVGDLSTTPLHRCKGRHHLPIIGEEMQGDMMPKVPLGKLAQDSKLEPHAPQTSSIPLGSVAGCSYCLDPSQSTDSVARSCDSIQQTIDILAAQCNMDLLQQRQQQLLPTPPTPEEEVVTTATAGTPLPPSPPRGNSNNGQQQKPQLLPMPHPGTEVATTAAAATTTLPPLLPSQGNSSQQPPLLPTSEEPEVAVTAGGSPQGQEEQHQQQQGKQEIQQAPVAAEEGKTSALELGQGGKEGEVVAQ